MKNKKFKLGRCLPKICEVHSPNTSMFTDFNYHIIDHHLYSFSLPWKKKCKHVIIHTINTCTRSPNNPWWGSGLAKAWILHVTPDFKVIKSFTPFVLIFWNMSLKENTQPKIINSSSPTITLWTLITLQVKNSYMTVLLTVSCLTWQINHRISKCNWDLKSRFLLTLGIQLVVYTPFWYRLKEIQSLQQTQKKTNFPWFLNTV